MSDTRRILEDLLSLCQQRTNMEELLAGTEREMMVVVRNMEEVRKKWLHAEQELKKFKELLVKSDVAKAALEVQLKHARNQLDVEMTKRHKVEADYHNLTRQMKLVHDILVHDSDVGLNDVQKGLLATFSQKAAGVTAQRSSRRLTVIDESSFLFHSDISYDHTEDELDLDSTLLKPLRSRAQERRRSSMVHRTRGGANKSAEKEVEATVKAVLASPQPGRHKPTVQTQQPVQLVPVKVASVEEGKQSTEKPLQHVFLSKTVIRPETCGPCGKRIRFGKMVVKCRNCRAVAHPECKQRLPGSCCIPGSQAKGEPSEGIFSAARPRIPQLIVDCVAEIERRGLQEKGLYRVPGGERPVKELRERCRQGNPALVLSTVPDIHVICGLLKDFLRKLKEPLITFKLHKMFMEAAELSDKDESSARIHQAIAELPKPNRDTLAFLLLHFHKIMRSPHCQMDQNNLARVFGPTIVGHGISQPSPTTILRDTNTQPKVICHLLSMPEDFWKRVLSNQMDPVQPSSSNKDTPKTQGCFLKTSTSPDLNIDRGPSSPTSVLGRFRNLNTRPERGWKFFASPSLPDVP